MQEGQWTYLHSWLSRGSNTIEIVNWPPTKIKKVQTTNEMLKVEALTPCYKDKAMTSVRSLDSKWRCKKCFLAYKDVLVVKDILNVMNQGIQTTYETIQYVKLHDSVLAKQIPKQWCIKKACIKNLLKVIS